MCSVQTQTVNSDIAPPREEITYLEVPFGEKDKAKALGARWDPKKVRWYVPSYLEISEFHRWNKKRLYLAPEPDFDRAEGLKDLGARWDRAAERLYIIPEDVLDIRPFHSWITAAE